jgi:hypothetical protein
MYQIVKKAQVVYCFIIGTPSAKICALRFSRSGVSALKPIMVRGGIFFAEGAIKKSALDLQTHQRDGLYATGGPKSDKISPVGL